MGNVSNNSASTADSGLTDGGMEETQTSLTPVYAWNLSRSGL